MRSEWINTTLGELFKVKHGFAFKGEFFTNEPTNSLLVTPGNFAVGGGFQNPKPKYYTGPVPAEYVLQPGQIVVTMTDLSKQSDTLGLPAVIPADGLTWLHNQRVGLLDFKEERKTHPRFVSYLLRAHSYRSWVIGSATGTTVKHTSPRRIESFECFVPPYKEQKAIAHILGSLDDKIELNRQMNETLEAMAQALFKSWFVDFDPVIDNALAAGNEIPEPLRLCAAARQALSSQRKPLPADIQSLFPDRFVFTEEMGWVPEGWTNKSIYQLIDVVNGAPFSSKEFNGDSLGKPVIRIRDLKTGTPQVFTEEVHPKGTLIKRGDLLVGMDAEFRATLWSGAEGWMNQRVFLARPKFEYLNSFYLKEVLKPLLAQEENAQVGTTVAHLGKKDIDKFEVFLPNAEIITSYSEITNGVLERWILTKEQVVNLKQLRNTLLPKLLSGELRIPDAEKQVAEAV